MARGWESKSVESQQVESPSSVAQGEGSTREDLKRKQKRESLELSRRRVLHEMETTRSDARRTSLEQALAFLEGQIAELS